MKNLRRIIAVGTLLGILFSSTLVSATIRSQSGWCTRMSLFDDFRGIAANESVAEPYQWFPLWETGNYSETKVNEAGELELSMDVLWNNYKAYIDVDNLKALYQNPDGGTQGETCIFLKAYYKPGSEATGFDGKNHDFSVYMTGQYRARESGNIFEAPLFKKTDGVTEYDFHIMSINTQYPGTPDEQDPGNYDGGADKRPTLQLTRVDSSLGIGDLVGGYIRFNYSPYSFQTIDESTLVSIPESGNKVLPAEQRGKICIQSFGFGRRIRYYGDQEILTILQDAKVAKQADDTYKLSARVFNFMPNVAEGDTSSFRPKVVLAGYNENGVLVNLNVQEPHFLNMRDYPGPLTDGATSEQINLFTYGGTAEATIPAGDYSSVKGFIWKDFSTLTPYLPSQILD